MRRRRGAVAGIGGEDSPRCLAVDWILYIVASGFALFGVICLALVVLSLPGTWIMIAVALIIELVDGLYLSGETPTTFGWWVLLACLAVAGVGELLELAAGALGAKTGGGTRRGMVGAIIGGILGAIAMTPLIPIPVIGTLIGALIGTFLGAIVGEVSADNNPMTVRRSIRPATGATIGRVLGTVGKIGTALVVWLVLTVSAFWP